MSSSSSHTSAASEESHLDGAATPAYPGKRNLTQSIGPSLGSLADRVASVLQRRADGAGAAGGGDDAESAVAAASSSTGAPLRADVREKFEGSLGTDLSAVRVHTGDESAAASKAVGAHAYATGNDIHFAQGMYQPDDPFGLHLLAHEVAHTVQQSGGGFASRQHKLEVSSPGDAAEHEADRAAESMVRGQPFAVGGGGAGTLQRDQAPDAKPGVAAPTTAPGSEQVSIDWWVDWQNKQVGAPVSDKSNARTGRDAAYGTLKVTPDKDAGVAEPIKWVNAAPSGAVALRPITQKKDSGGEVSSDIAWGKPPAVSSEVKVTQVESDADPKRKPGASQLEAKKRAAAAAVSERLGDELLLKGDIAMIKSDLQAAASAAVGAAAEGYEYEVSVTVRQILDPNAGNPKATSPVRYDKAGKDERRTANIVVPTEIKRLNGHAAVEIDDANGKKTTTKTASSDSDSKSEELTVDTSVVTEVTTSVQSEFHRSWEELKKKLTTTSLSGSAGISGKIGGANSANASLKDLEIDLGTVLAIVALPEVGPRLALFLKKAIGKGKVGGDFHTQLEGELRGHLEGKAAWTDEDLKQTLNKYDMEVKTRMNTRIATDVKTHFKKTSAESHSKSSSTEASDDASKRRKSASSTETVGVKYIIGEPTMTVKNG